MNRAIPAWAFALLGCAASGPSISVDLRTDYVAGIEFSAVRVTFEADTVGPVSRERPAYGEQSFIDGVRIAELGDLGEARQLDIDVRLLDVAEAVLFSRRVRVQVRGPTVVTVVASRDCRGVMCPLPAGDPALTACLGGRCVDPRCTVEAPEFCGESACSLASDCPGAAGCAEPMCVAGTCVFADRGICAPGEWCNPDFGCVGAPPGSDDCLRDADGDGVSRCDGDCDDGDPSVFPGAVETCTDCRDLDCDGAVTPCEAGTTIGFYAPADPPNIDVFSRVPFTGVYLLHWDGADAVGPADELGWSRPPDNPPLGFAGSALWHYRLAGGATLGPGTHRFEFRVEAADWMSARMVACVLYEVP